MSCREWQVNKQFLAGTTKADPEFITVVEHNSTSFSLEEVALLLDRLCVLQVNAEDGKEDEELIKLIKRVGFQLNNRDAYYWPSKWHRDNTFKKLT